jgi:hypothetical protein
MGQGRGDPAPLLRTTGPHPHRGDDVTPRQPLGALEAGAILQLRVEYAASAQRHVTAVCPQVEATAISETSFQ